jgi:hypothetical protein
MFIIGFLLGFFACAFLAIKMLERKGLMVDGRIIDFNDRPSNPKLEE